MRCRDVRRLLVTEGGIGYGLPVLGAALRDSEFCDSEFRGSRAFGRLGRHLDACAVCRREADRLAAEAELIRRAFAALPVPADLVDVVRRRIHAARDPGARRGGGTG
jgi:hypothetical protein